ncbi:MAG: hypothetical protein LBR76_04410 [Oscillospiraceae bacterium]|nr:hypothetical protein [Oscillospiraceae bacterium]
MPRHRKPEREVFRVTQLRRKLRCLASAAPFDPKGVAAKPPGDVEQLSIDR